MTEEARISELLKPRVKVIADWPGNHTLFVGDILTIYDDGKNAPLFVSSNGDKYGLTFDPKSYPHLFREMQWWEDRKPEEMPEYVKNKCDPGQPFNVYEVKGYAGCGKVVEFKDGSEGLSEYWLPATKTEYDQYIKTKQK